MGHGPSTEWQAEKSQAFKAKLGIIMFVVYTPIYLAFILISVISPSFMAKDVGSLNVAIVYGFGIIILAIIQAVIYNNICSAKERHDHVSDDKKGEVKQ
jgi:uncharacterized membrane protein (DUF485 family)